MRSREDIESKISDLRSEMIELRKYKGDFMSSTKDIQDAKIEYERKKHHLDTLKWVLEIKDHLQ